VFLSGKKKNARPLASRLGLSYLLRARLSTTNGNRILEAVKIKAGVKANCV
jgi:hypothetical protein